MSDSGKAEGTVVRMTFLFRAQHMLLTVLLLVLAVTGFALMYHENAVAQAIIRFEGGVQNRGVVHRVAAVLLLANLVYHVFYMLLTKEGKAEFRDFSVTRKDFSDFLQAMWYNLGQADAYPRIGKYGFREKFQYWGTAVGIVLIAATGIMLWAETFSMRFFPKFVLDLTLIVHGYQGLLGFVILFLWHMYNVHLHPSSFPMNAAWLTGKVSAEWMRKEHPLEYERLKEDGTL
ncbi:MAG: cytochrome b/b6 domain-containing protein [Thermodesulfobacteriota bacterium]